MMHELESNSVIKAIEERIRMWIAEVDINIPDSQSEAGFASQTLPVNVFTEMGGQDKVTSKVLNSNDKTIYPYIFIEQLDRNTVRRERLGLIERYTYNYFMNLRYYISIDPFDRERVPRLNEELSHMELKLERVLQYLEMWDGLVETSHRRSTVQSGVLHFFMNVYVHEDTVPYEHEKMEELDIDMVLKGDKADEK